MKKNKLLTAICSPLSVALFATLLGILSSCEKEELPGGSILLTTEKHLSSEKTSVSGTTVQWVNGDAVWFYVGNTTPFYCPVNVDGSNAYVSDDKFPSNDNPIRAYYPYAIIDADNLGCNTNTPTVVIPKRYECSYVNGRQVLPLPLAALAQSGAKKIEFKHLTAAFKVVIANFTSYDLILDSVVVSSKDYLLSGAMGLDLTQSDYGITAVTTSDSNFVSVCFANGPTLNAGGTNQTEVQVPIRPIGESAKPLRIEIFAHGRGDAIDDPDAPTVYKTVVCHYSHTNDVSNLGRNKMITAQVGLRTQSGDHTSINMIDNSLFSVSSNKKVRFSKGNLWCTTSSGYTFHTNQYDCNGTTQLASNKDLFPWKDTTYISDWSVLSAEEWNYLINTRPGDRFAKACVNGVNGLIIFSDTYRHPIALALVKVNYSGSMNYSENTFDTGKWESMEAAGAIFLPAVHNGGGTGHYWSSNEGTSGNAKRLYFSDSELTTTVDEDQTNTCSVRLVKE
jgi:hypothetical protein